VGLEVQLKPRPGNTDIWIEEAGQLTTVFPSVSVTPLPTFPSVFATPPMMPVESVSSVDGVAQWRPNEDNCMETWDEDMR
jgi:hypothetical protein